MVRVSVFTRRSLYSLRRGSDVPSESALALERGSEQRNALPLSRPPLTPPTVAKFATVVKSQVTVMVVTL